MFGTGHMSLLRSEEELKTGLSINMSLLGSEDKPCQENKNLSVYYSEIQTPKCAV
jgi:hypothetical protein